MSRFNTPTIFNVRHSFHLNWEGRQRSLKRLIDGSMSSSSVMNDAGNLGVERLRRDPVMRARFTSIFGRPADRLAIIDALHAYIITLDTPDAPFDRWLRGERSAITAEALRGYRLFNSIGCAACHQGINVGANLRQRHGIFHPIGSPEPDTLRVPGLRNVAVTAPYFHDGSAETLEKAIGAMAKAQLDRALPENDVSSIAAFLRSLTGRYHGRRLKRPDRKSADQ